MIARTRWLTVVIAVVALVAVAVVARSHPSHPFTKLDGRPGAASGPVITPPVQTTLPQRTVSSAPKADGDRGSNNLHWLGSLLLALLAAGAILALGRFTRGRWGFDFGGRHRGASGGDALPAMSSTAPPELTDAVEQGLGDIEHGEVTDAIIACWMRVESAAGTAGVPARASETSTEFVDRVLGTFGARERSLRRMSALYREARFSEHVLGESSRVEARECLRAIRDDLGAANESA